MISNKLISHQVFETIQGGISDSPMGKGKILFANKFTGEPVEMDEQVRAALSHDGTFIGNNPINQLEKALAGVPGGPWVIDIRNECIYIHNKALDQPATYDYVYGSENGELLSVNFKTQYITKNAPRGGTMSFDQFSKTLRMQSHSQTSAQEIAADVTNRTAIKVLYQRAYEARSEARVSTMYPRQNQGGGVAIYNPTQMQTFIEYINSQSHSTYTDLESLYVIDLGTLQNWYDKYIEYLKQRSQTNMDLYNRFSSGADINYLRRSESNAIYQKQSYDEFKPLVADFLNQTLGESDYRYRNEVEQELRKAFQQGPEAVKEVLHRYFDNTTYSQYTHDGVRELTNIEATQIFKKDMRLSPYFTQSPMSGPGSIFYTASDGYFEIRGENARASVICATISKALESQGYTSVKVVAYDQKIITGLLGAIVGVKCKCRLTIRSQFRNYHRVSGYQFMYDFYTRYTGSPNSRYTQYIRRQALGSNTSRKVTQQRLEVEMVVVGRPSLTANGKIKISNVGSRSGDYIIKRCIHQITPGEGYTCSLTLEQGTHNEPVGTVTNDVPITSKPKKTGGGSSTGGGQRSRNNGNQTVNTTPTEPISIWVTPAERSYFETLLASNDPVAAQEEFVTQLKYSREQAYQRARQQGKSEAEALEAVRQVNMSGIVSVKNKHVSSDNLYLRENLEPHYANIPQRYRVAYYDEVHMILQESVKGIKARLN